MTVSLRETTMAAAAASLQAMWPARRVERGMQDLALVGDEVLRQGLFTLIAEGTSGWTEYTGREGEYGTLRFVVVGYRHAGSGPDDSATPLQVEQAEAELEAEVLAWCRAIKPAPLDAVYPKDAAYSRGLEAPLGWIVIALEALYV